MRVFSAAAVMLMLWLISPRPLTAQPDSLTTINAVSALIRRVVPADARHFTLELIPQTDSLDVFEVASRDGKILLRGSSGVAIASALGWYLEHVAGVNVPTPLDGPIHLNSVPMVTTPVRISTPYRYRYFFNYCTFSYSMAWWNWDDWQRMIDWMALKGINLPLAVTGQEATWQLTLRDLGFSDQQIADFLVGPAYFPWGWMGNIDGLGGPLPQHWIDTHITLERQILARERSLGMTPVLQGFTGHVPESISRVFPDAKIHQTGDWSAGFSGTWFLDPMDPLFQRMARTFIERQQELYGSDHVYAADPFNEINPPTDDSTFLAEMGSAIYRGMASADSLAVWVLQGWFLYYQANFWKEPQARALLGAVSDDRMIVLDLYGDSHPVWTERKAFYGKPWIWNVLYNFGGQVSVSGNLPRMARNLAAALESPDHGRMSGIGMTMEGLGYNPVVPDFVLDMTWRDTVPQLQPWVRDYVVRRYGRPDVQAWDAWKILLATAYSSAPQTGTFLAERPQFYQKGVAYRTSPVVPYDGTRLVRALNLLLGASSRLRHNDAYQYDVVNLTRQVLGQLGLPMVDSVQAAYRRKDRKALERAEQRVVELLRDLDTLVGTRKEFLLGRWLEDAKSWGETDDERALYEWNARNIITLWGTKCTEGENDDLNLYAYKQWQGMFTDYYLPRWEEFFRRLNASLDEGKEFDRSPFAEWSCQWEQAWSKERKSYRTRPEGDPIGTAKRLVAKYGLGGDGAGARR
ncbi:MAG TPA: alpha-N-acetylglucosaminidase [Gemmatimonadales bacterium]|nr:alpha-N-acetylglucosaminidase [Gemmatimonadales bacterium]